MKNYAQNLLRLIGVAIIILLASPDSMAQFGNNNSNGGFGSEMLSPVNRSSSPSFMFGEGVLSPDRSVKLLLQNDGNLVLQRGNDVVWQSNTAHQGVVKATFNTEGQFVLLNASGEVKWASSTKNTGANTVVVSNDANFGFATDYKIVWSLKPFSITDITDPSYHAVGVSGDFPVVPLDEP